MPTPPPWWTLTQVAPRRRVQERVQDRPVGDRVGAVAHRLGLAVRRGDRARVQVVAADHDRRLHAPGRDELVEDPAGPSRARRSRASRCARAGPGTARARCASRSQRTRRLVVREGVHQRAVGRVDVLGIAGERDPAERPLALAEERADVRGDEAGVVEGAARRRSPPRGGCCCRSRRARRPARWKLEHRAHVRAPSTRSARVRYAFGSRARSAARLGDREPGRARSRSAGRGRRSGR